MLKGHVFSKQLFENQIFALFINTFLNGNNGVASDYGNAMNITYSGSDITVDSGAVCIQGRFLEEDTSTTISAGSTSAYCKLVIEINLDEENSESEFNQGTYRIVTSSSAYPSLTQTDIVKNNAGTYQYELARFKTSANGISDFADKRTFLDLESIYDSIRTAYKEVLKELETELANVEDGSDYLLKSSGGTVEGEITASGGIVSDNIKNTSGSNVLYEDDIDVDKIVYNDDIDIDDIVYKDDFAILTGTVSSISATSSSTKTISYPTNFTYSNSIPVAFGIANSSLESSKGYSYVGSYEDSADVLMSAYKRRLNLNSSNITISIYNPNSSSVSVKYRIVLMKIS